MLALRKVGINVPTRSNMADAASEQKPDGPPSLFCAIGSETTVVSEDDLYQQLRAFLNGLGDREDVLLIPPDFTRYPSQAGLITQIISEHYKFTSRTSGPEPPIKIAKTEESDETTSSGTLPKIQILPALGTHAPMTDAEIRKMYGDALADMDPSPFLVHDWRNDVVTIGEAPASMVKNATRGMVEKPWPAQLNKAVWNKRRSQQNPSEQKHPSLVLSIGQVSPVRVSERLGCSSN